MERVIFSSPYYWSQHFEKIGEKQRHWIASWHSLQEAENEDELEFLARVKKALNVINYEYGHPLLEPSIGWAGEIYYAIGHEVGRFLTVPQWETAALAFAPEYYSYIGTLEEHDLFNALRIVRNELTLDYVCNDSSSMGNYFDSPTCSEEMELSGVRIVGKTADGIGNTYKIVKQDSHFSLCGGSHVNSGKQFTVSTVCYHIFPNEIQDLATAIITVKNL